MSPRKEQYRIPKWQVQQFQARRDKMLYGPYSCPKCKQVKLKVNIDKQEKNVTLICSNCGLEQSSKYVSLFEPVDYYNKFLDDFSQ